MYTKITKSKARTHIQRIAVQQFTVHIKITLLGSKENGQNAIFLDNHQKKKRFFFLSPHFLTDPVPKLRPPPKKKKVNKQIKIMNQSQDWSSNTSTSILILKTFWFSTLTTLSEFLGFFKTAYTNVYKNNEIKSQNTNPAHCNSTSDSAY